MSVRWTVVVTALVLALGVGIGLSQAKKKKHSHKVAVSYKTQNFSVPSGEVNFGAAFCPRNALPVGGGVDDVGDGGYPFMNIAVLDPAARAYAVFITNEGVGTSSMQTRVACVKSKTGKAKARAASRDQFLGELEDRLKAMRAERP
jgi:hypothetical protein